MGSVQASTCREAPRRAAIRAGCAYFAIVLAVAFGSGTVRTLFIAPRIGPVAAVLALAVLLFGRRPARHWASHAALPARIGLGAHLVFGLSPLWRRR